jgi:hypothetical protein
MPNLPAPIALLSDSLMAALDHAMPGQLSAFYLVGSVALRDYRDGHSDLDFIAVLSHPPDTQALAKVHADMANRFPDIDCDGIYLDPQALSKPPAGLGAAARDGRLTPQSADERHPVSWLLLADSGIALRGPFPHHNWVAADRSAAMAYSRSNLLTYWQKWLKTFDATRSTLSHDQLDEAVHWGVLGALRVHATMITGRVPSKSAAGPYGQSAFPRHAPIIAEALRLRQTGSSPSLYAEPGARGADTVELLAAVTGSA